MNLRKFYKCLCILGPHIRDEEQDNLLLQYILHRDFSEEHGRKKGRGLNRLYSKLVIRLCLCIIRQAERGPWWISRRYTQRRETWTNMKGSLITGVLIPWYSTGVWYQGICVCVSYDCRCCHRYNPKNDEWCQKKFTVYHYMVGMHPILYTLLLNVVQQIYQ
jgi:hypothetical protein